MSWYQLHSILEEGAALADYYRSVEPTACPRDGTPLDQGPPQDAAMKFCHHCGWQYPRDYNVQSDAGM